VYMLVKVKYYTVRLMQCAACFNVRQKDGTDVHQACTLFTGHSKHNDVYLNFCD